MALGRIIGLDIGHVRIGVAQSDPFGMIASPHSVIRCTNTQEDIEAVRAIVEESEAIRIVAGLPLDQNGEVGPQAEKTLAFVEQLRNELDIEVVTQDERFSSAAAERMLIDANVRRKKRKQVVDKVAATHILQVYLDRAARSRDGS